MSRLDGKVAIITGGGSGIGLAAAQLFAQEGAQVVIFELDPERAAASGLPYRIADVTSAPQVEAAVSDVVRSLGQLDILVNVAGGSGRRWGDGPTDACTLEGWERTLALNLDSAFYCCKYSLGAMFPRGRGAIVTISSVQEVVAKAAVNDVVGVVRLAVQAAIEFVRTESLVRIHAERRKIDRLVQQTRREGGCLLDLAGGADCRLSVWSCQADQQLDRTIAAGEDPPIIAEHSVGSGSA